jgi:hypothetical protein
MADTIYLKRGETRDVEAYLQDGNGAAVSLTGAVIKFQMRGRFDSTLKVDRAATVVDAPTAYVRATLTSTDTDTAGNYIAEWRATYAGGYRIFPEGDYISVKVLEDLA